MALRTAVAASVSSSISRRNETGSPKPTRVCRPCSRMIRSWRSGPTLAHASAKSALTSESCDPGDRPQRIVTGSSCASSAGWRNSVAVICARVTEGSMVRVLSGFRLRTTENTARVLRGNSGPIGAKADGRPSRLVSSSSTSRLDRCRSWRT